MTKGRWLFGHGRWVGDEAKAIDGWEENKHPRDKGGKFGSGGSSKTDTYKVYETAGGNHHEHYIDAASPEEAIEKAKKQGKFKHKYTNFHV